MGKIVYITLALILSSRAFAVNVQQFNRSSSLTYEMIEDARLKNSHVKNKYKYLINLGFSHVDEPLTVKNNSNTRQTNTVIGNMNSVHLGLSSYLTPDIQLSIDTSYSFYKNNIEENISDFQDINLKLKKRLISEKRWAFSLMPKIVIPLKGGETLLYDDSDPPFSYGRDNTLSDNGLGLGLMAIHETLFTYFQMALNLSYYYNDKAKFTDGFNQTHIDKSQVISAGLGLYIPFHEKFGLNLEFIKNYYSPFFNSNLNPSEVFVGLSTALNQSTHAFLGGGFGNLLSSSDGNDYRFVGGFKIIPFYKDKKTDQSVNAQFEKKQTRIIEVEQKLQCHDKNIFGETSAFTLLFENDSHKISSKQKKDLLLISEILNSQLHHIKSIVVNGHTSIVGDERYNYLLGLKRAEEVINFLGQQGIAEGLIIKSVSKGELEPLRTRNIASYNRRVEVLIELNDNKEDCNE